ncbi:MAG: hypothetical protein C0502_04760 [Opitutus sp.]|nr:hypothetical protein [Opitutus sp.]
MKTTIHVPSPIQGLRLASLSRALTAALALAALAVTTRLHAQVPASLPTQTLTILGGSGSAGGIAANVEYYNPATGLWQRAYLTGWHPWGFVSGTNSWINYKTSNVSDPGAGANGTNSTFWYLYRVRFTVPADAIDPKMTFSLKADNFAQVAINGATAGGSTRYINNTYMNNVIEGAADQVNVDAVFSQNVHPGENTITLNIGDHGGLNGFNFRIDLSMKSSQPLDIIPVQPPVNWVNWTGSETAGGITKYVGQMTVPRSSGGSTTVIVKYTSPSGGIAFFQTSNGTDYFRQGSGGSLGRNPARSPYTSTKVPNIPDGGGGASDLGDIIALKSAGTNLLEFFDAATGAPISVASPVFAYVSLNGNGYGFNQDFDILSFGDGTTRDQGYWGPGTSYKNTVTVGSATQYQLLGGGEPHGTLQFRGSFSTVTWQSLSNEYWNGFTIGVAQLAADVPIANAGLDQTVTATSSSGASVQLSGSVSGSTSAPFSFRWTGPFGTASGQNPTVSLPVGTHTITLKVTDATNAFDSDTVVVTVLPAPADTTPPVISAPADITAEATSAAGAVVTFSATATDEKDGPVPVVAVPASGSTFPLGMTAVGLAASDSAGNTATAEFDVLVRDTTAPALTVSSNVTAEATSAAGAVVSYAAATATDAVGVTALTYSQASGSQFPLGATTVTVTARDAAGNSSSGTFTIAVQDTTAPALTVPASQTLEATSASGAVATFAATATDAVGVTALTYSHASGGIFPLGPTTVTVTARDAAGNSSSGTFTITVRDTTAPTITSLSTTAPTLWPPNHKMVAVTVSASASDLVGVTSLKIVNVTSNEPDNGLGDGDTPGDIQVTGNLTLNLRAERSGTGNGRVYTITVEARDAAGNASTRTVAVGVPKSQGK